MAIISAFMEYLSGNMIEEFEEKDSKIELWKSYGRLLNSRRI